MTSPTLTLPTPTQRTPHIAFPLVLIAIGVAFLLANLGYLGGITWNQVLQLWPILLVLGGVDLLLRPRSFALAVLVEVAIVAATFVYLVSAPSPVVGALSFTADVPRAAATDLGITVNYGAGSFTLSGGATSLVSVRSSQEDIQRTVDQSGGAATVTLSSASNAVFGWDGRDRRWDVQLPSDVRTAMTLNLGAGSFDLDLSNIHVSRATINAGASTMNVKLPSPKGDVPVKISTGVSSVTLSVPAGVAYRVTYTGLLSVTGPTSSAGYDTAADRLTIDISAAMSSVSIR